MKTNHYFYELPNNYKCIKVIDAKDKKTTAYFILGSIVLLIITFVLCALVFFKKYTLDDVFNNVNIPILVVFIISMFAYIVLHELVHGLFYKIFTHEKLTYGFTLTVAYCGVPKLYVKRGSAIITTLAPFVIFSVVFLLPMLFINNPAIIFVLILLFSIHFSGCVGDLWVAYYMIFRNKGKKVIVNDTGPKQSFFVEEEEDANIIS